jgi:hypothetical protein
MRTTIESVTTYHALQFIAYVYRVWIGVSVLFVFTCACMICVILRECCVTAAI